MKNIPDKVRSRLWQKMGFAALVIGSLALAPISLPGTVFAQDNVFMNNQADNQALTEYWTPERMRQAVPMDVMARAQDPQAQRSTATEARLPEDAIPGYTLGWQPGSGPQPDPQKVFKMSPDNPLYAAAAGDSESLTQGPFSPPSSPTDFANYGPFSRWTWFGRYLTYPTSTIGKLFFTIPGVGNFVCSASVIGQRTIATAAHCVADRFRQFDNFSFCPSYNAGGINPATGCWGWQSAAVSQAWTNSEATDRDYGCIVTSPTNATTGQPVGNVTGWTGRTFNLSTKQPITAFGYPQGSPFPGNTIIISAAPEWYEVNMTPSDGQVSKYIGSDQTGGSSGGPWWISIRHPQVSREYGDVDGSDETDPGQGDPAGPFINGVNSHRRCIAGGCPPGSVFLSEMGSPQFRNTIGDTDESEDVFNTCLGQE